MKKYLYSIIAVAVIAAFLLPSCGGGSNKSETSFSDTTIVVNHDKLNGVLSDFFTIEKCVFRAESEYTTFIKFEIKRTSNLFPFNVKDVVCDEWKPIAPKVLTLNAELIDNNGIPMNWNLVLYNKDNLAKTLYLKTNESMWLQFVINKDYRELLKGLKHVKISSSMVDVSTDEIAQNKAFRDNLNKQSESATSTEPKKEEAPVVEEKVAKKQDTKKWDEALDSYEEYTNQYIKLYKKAMQENDMTALQEYPKYVEKLTALTKKMEAAKGELTTEQASRFMDIQMKYTQALSSIN